MYVSVNSMQLPNKIDVTKKEVSTSNDALLSSNTSTPFSPVTPSPTNTPLTSHHPIRNITPLNLEEEYSLKAVLKHKGYIPLKRLSKTLQGSIWKVLSISNKETYIIKVTNKCLHYKSIAYVEGHTYNTHENIVKETAILKYLNDKNSHTPNSLIKYIDQFCDKYNYFLVMEFGGTNLFDFVKECHEYIKKQIIDISEWHKFCKTAMKQMVNVLDFMHNKMACVHMDLSLENFTIKNIRSCIIMNHTKKKIVFSDDFQIKLIDFGLSEVFPENKNGDIDFRCNKYVGKQFYKAPEVYNKKNIFDSRSADCWSLAVCFFMMFFGCQPFNRPSMKDHSFKLIMNGQLIDILNHWNLIQNVSPEILDLLIRLFRIQKYRLNIQQIKQHSFLK